MRFFAEIPLGAIRYGVTPGFAHFFSDSTVIAMGQLNRVREID